MRGKIIMRVNRNEYLAFLKRHRNQPVIKVLSGVRRCGKSTLFEIYRDYLIEEGVQPHQIIMINLEDIEHEELQEYHALYNYVNDRLYKDQKMYVFIDEVQCCEKFEKAIDSLYIKRNVDLYITGSNAYFMSGELATLLSGRYVEIKILPLSFQEFVEGKQIERNKEALKGCFQEYLKTGGFPYLLNVDDEQSKKEYLQGIYHSILIKDIIARYKITDVLMLESVVKFIFHNIGNRLSMNNIANTMTSMGRKIDYRMVEKYVFALQESLMIDHVKRYNITGKQLLATQGKYYLVDIALRSLLVSSRQSDLGHLLENIVYLELKRRGYDVYIGQMQTQEVDFVGIKDGKTEYFQVSATVMDSATLERELSSLTKIKDHYPKYLLTLDDYIEEADYNGIQQKNVITWLLNK